MCSVVQEDFEVEQVDPVKPNTKLKSGCKKCTEKAVIVLQKIHCYCRSCFLKMVTHKFRSTLGKTKLVKHDENILAIFYGDQNSIALLHLLEQGVSENTHKRIRFKSFILYVDESALWTSDLNKANILDGVWKSLKCSFDCYVIKLSSVYTDYTFYNIKDVQPSFILEQNEDDVKLKNYFNEIKSPSSKIDFILRLRYLIQTEVCRKLQCSKVLTPECGTDLSIRLLSDVILGRGSQISSDVGVCDNKLSNLSILRPLREITTKEVTFYNVFNELPIQTVPSITSMFDSVNSIQQVTESFICNLQEEFPSTVYTVFHTGDKLKMAENLDQDDICVMCNNKIDSSKCPVSLLPKSTSSSSESNNEKKSCKDCSCKKNQTPEITRVLKNSLCYGCNRLINDMDTLDILPDRIVEKAKQKLHSEQMRTKIEDFLL